MIPHASCASPPPPVRPERLDYAPALRQLHVGGSFLVPRPRHRCCHVYTVARRLGITITTQDESGHGVEQTRVWRVA